MEKNEKPKSPGDIQAEEKLKQWMKELGLSEENPKEKVEQD